MVIALSVGEMVKPMLLLLLNARISFPSKIGYVSVGIFNGIVDKVFCFELRKVFVSDCVII